MIGSDLGADLTTWQKEVITSATTLGALVGGLVAGAASDYTGRKKVLALANLVFIAGAWLQAAAHTVSTMVLGRLVVGLGVGFASCIAPLYVGELAPTRQRGRLVTINAVACTLGQVVAYAVGAAFARAPAGWRWMVGLGAAPAVVQLVALAFLPESRECVGWDVDQSDDADDVLRSAHPAHARRHACGPCDPRAHISHRVGARYWA